MTTENQDPVMPKSYEEQQEGISSNDDTDTASETSPAQEMEASSSSEHHGDASSSTTSDVEKGVLKDGELDSDTDDTVAFENDSYPLWMPLWFLNYGWFGVLAILIPILFIIVISSVFGHVFSSSSLSSDGAEGQAASNVDLSLISTPVPSSLSSDGNEGQAASNVDLSLISTPVPTVVSSDVPTPTPTTASPTTAPTTSMPSTLPSSSPSFFPTIAPRLEPVVSHDFMVRLYWHPDFFWQETYEETWWCMECAECKRFVLGDGWEGECVTPGSTPASCQEGDQIWVRHCKDERRLYTFEIIKNFGTGDQVRVHGTSLCFSIINEIYLELRTCDQTKSEQLFAPIEDTMKFELRPYDQRDLSDRDANCLSQRHHPKDKEMVGMFRCRTNIRHETNYWTEFYR